MALRIGVRKMWVAGGFHAYDRLIGQTLKTGRSMLLTCLILLTRIRRSFMSRVFLALALCGALVSSTSAKDPPPNPPAIFQNDSNNMLKRIEDKHLFTFEKELQKQFVGKGPDEVFALATSGSFDFILDLFDKPATPEELLIIAVYGKRIELRWSPDHGKNQHRRELVAEEIDFIRKFVSKEKVDGLPLLGSTRVIDGKERVVVGGTIHVYLHLNKRSGIRVLINNPPTRGEDKYPPDDPVWKYTKVVDFFNTFKPPE